MARLARAEVFAADEVPFRFRPAVQLLTVLRDGSAETCFHRN